MRRYEARRVLVLALLLPLWSCDKDTQTGAMIGADEAKQSELPRVEVKLPPSPSFKREHAPERYQDGSFSVYGLRKEIDKNVDKDARVTGFVIEVYECPPCPKGAQCEPCSQPHFWLADGKHDTRDKAMMVVGFPEKDPKTHKPLKFEVGANVVVSGQFTKASGTGFRASDGLVVYAEHQVVGQEQAQKPSH